MPWFQKCGSSVHNQFNVLSRPKVVGITALHICRWSKCKEGKECLLFWSYVCLSLANLIILFFHLKAINLNSQFTFGLTLCSTPLGNLSKGYPSHPLGVCWWRYSRNEVTVTLSGCWLLYCFVQWPSAPYTVISLLYRSLKRDTGVWLINS